jgi:hypothetical protein
MGRFLAWVAVAAVAVIAVGWLVANLISALFGLMWYLVVGVLVVGGGYWLYRRARRALAPETRNRRRIEAAIRTRRVGDR